MNENIKNDKIKNIISGLTQELKSVRGAHSDYYDKLSHGESVGFFADEKRRKELARNYYEFASLLAASASKMEALLAALPVVILDADKEGRQDRVLLCDSLLTRYGEFKKAISSLAALSERALSSDKVSPAQLLNALSEFGYKLNYFEGFLFEHRD